MADPTTECAGLTAHISSLLIVLLLPLHSTSFSFNKLFPSLKISDVQKTFQCSEICNCSRRSAEDMMLSYMQRYTPHMGQHMNFDRPIQSQADIIQKTAWLGHMADIRCHIGKGIKVHLTDLLHTSTLLFKALRLSCDDGVTVMWDLQPFTSDINIMEVNGCQLKPVADIQNIILPRALWILHFERIPETTAQLISFIHAMDLTYFVWINSDISHLPESWANTSLHNLKFAWFGNNYLQDYKCEFISKTLVILNLDNNNLSVLPSCLLIGHIQRINHLSISNNFFKDLGELYHHKQSSNTSENTPYLQSLDVSYNKLTKLNKLREVKWLKALDVSHNLLENIDIDTFSLNPSIEWLDLSYNRIQCIVKSTLTILSTIKHLNLSHNHLHTFDIDQTPASKNVLEFDLRYNILSYPPFSNAYHSSSGNLKMRTANNPFTCDCSINTFLQLLASKNGMQLYKWFFLGHWMGPRRNQPYIDADIMYCNNPVDMRGTPVLSLSVHKPCRLLKSCPVGCKCELGNSVEPEVTVDCSGLSNMNQLPANLPMIEGASLVLYVNKTGLKKLDHQPYLQSLTRLYAGDSRLSTVTPEAIIALANVSVLHLENNRLRHLPSVVKNLPMPSAVNISLSGNPWTCGCNDLWMPAWLKKYSNTINSANTIRCHWTDKVVHDFTPEDLRCGRFHYLLRTIALMVLVIFITLAIISIVRFKLEILVFMYTHFNIRLFNTYKHQPADETCAFDVFISFSVHDEKWVMENIVKELENHKNPYQTCVCIRDFLPGAPLAENIQWAMTYSNFTVLILTTNFLEYEWYIPEYSSTHKDLLKNSTSKLLIIIHGLLDTRFMDRELLTYLNAHTFLKTEDKWFWQKLMYILPKPIKNFHMSDVKNCPVDPVKMDLQCSTTPHSEIGKLNVHKQSNTMSNREKGNAIPAENLQLVQEPELLIEESQPKSDDFNDTHNKMAAGDVHDTRQNHMSF